MLYSYIYMCVIIYSLLFSGYYLIDSDIRYGGYVRGEVINLIFQKTKTKSKTRTKEFYC